ncbi:hypothetical protein F1880_001611 [Penicillium rolfsii]|nr:hypothetical protein F1880_001611 [Penicillium rolfsii]
MSERWFVQSKTVTVSHNLRIKIFQPQILVTTPKNLCPLPCATQKKSMFSVLQVCMTYPPQ